MAPLADSCPCQIFIVAGVWWEHVRAPGRIIVVSLSRGAGQTRFLFAVVKPIPSLTLGSLHHSAEWRLAPAILRLESRIRSGGDGT